MMKVRDIDGLEVRGMFRSPDGTLYVDDPSSHAKFKRHMDIATSKEERISMLENQLDEIKTLLGKLIGDQKC